MASGVVLQLHTKMLNVAASTAASRFASTLAAFVLKSGIITAKNSNTGTLYVGGSEATLRKGIPLTKGQSVNLGSIPIAGQIWGEIDPTTVYIWTTVANEKAILTYYG